MKMQVRDRHASETVKASKSLILIGSAMFGATFNLGTRVGLM